MEVILTLLLCALGFFIYLTDRNKTEVLRLRQELRDREIELLTLRAELHDRDILIEELRRQLAEKSSPSNLALPPPSSETFVSVIFREGDKKYYDYFVGDNDVRVGDFVEVYFNNKASGKVERRVAKVIYVSEPGEVSDYARSNIKRKVDRNEW